MEIERLVSGELNKSIEQCIQLLSDLEHKVGGLKTELAHNLNPLGVRTQVPVAGLVPNVGGILGVGVPQTGIVGTGVTTPIGVQQIPIQGGITPILGQTIPTQQLQSGVVQPFYGVNPFAAQNILGLSTIPGTVVPPFLGVSPLALANVPVINPFFAVGIGAPVVPQGLLPQLREVYLSNLVRQNLIGTLGRETINPYLGLGLGLPTLGNLRGVEMSMVNQGIPNLTAVPQTTIPTTMPTSFGYTW